MSTRRWVLAPSITAGFTLAFLLLLVAGIAIRRAQVETTGRLDEIERTLLLLNQVGLVQANVVEAEMGERGYLLTGAERSLIPYEEAVTALPIEIARLHELGADNPDARRLARLDVLTQSTIEELRREIELHRRGGPEALPSPAAMEAGEETRRDLRAVFRELRSDVQAGLQRREALRVELRPEHRAVIYSTIFFAAMLAGTTIVELNRQTLRRMIAEAERDRSLRAELALEERARATEALRVSEEQLRALFAASPLGKALVDPISRRFLRVNSRLCDVFGYTEAELLSRTVPELVAPEDDGREAVPRRRAPDGSADRYSEEIRGVRKDGTRIWVQIDVSVVRDVHGRALHDIAVIRDVTAHKAAEAEREDLLRDARRARADAERATAEAEAANRAKDQFLAVLSHEMRSPLHATVGWLSILKKGLADGRDPRRAVETVERNVGIQVQLVNDLLDVSRIVSDKLAIAAEPVPLPAVVHTAVENARPAAEAKDISLTCAVTLPAGSVLGDEPRLYQVVGNLLTNAIKFTPSGGRVTVTVAGHAGEATIQIRDTGAGIAPEFMAHVFDRFRQADATSTRAYSGLGIGLYLVKTLVELHGGSVAVSSEGAGKGATFTVRLPLLAAAPVGPAATASADSPPDALAGVTVLLVEDDADSRDALRLALEHSGAEVHACGSAGEARRALEQVQPDAIVSDIGMPGEDGHAFLRSVRASPRGDVPAIAITGFASKQDRDEAVLSGFDDHLAKPVPVDVLVAKLRDLTSRSRGRWTASGVIPRTARRSRTGES